MRTRVCIISDTHTRAPLPADNKNHAYRYPLPKADVLLHAGDITNEGYLSEYETIFEVLEAADAELKIIIAGNHDITLDEEYYARETRKKSVHGGKAIDPKAVKELWAGEKAKAAGIMYLEEGTNTIELKNGATFTVSLHYDARLIVCSIHTVSLMIERILTDMLVDLYISIPAGVLQLGFCISSMAG